MRTLFICNTFPRNPVTDVHGIFQRMRLFTDACMALSAEVDMLFFVPPAIDVSEQGVAGYQAMMRSAWGEKVNLFLVRHAANPRFHTNWDRYGAGIFDVRRQENYFPTCGEEQISAIESLLQRQPDAVVVQGLAAMLPLTLVRAPLPPVFFDLNDIEHRSHPRRVTTCPRWPGERLTLLHTPALKAAEMRAIRKANLTFVCSELDRVYLQKAARSDNLVVVQNAVPPGRRPLHSDGPNCLFVGTFAYGPNVQGANFLIKNIWPLVRQQMPQARLRIVGGQQEVLDDFSNPPEGVDFLGFVTDLDAVYDETRVVCCPIFAGAGTRIKIVEAAAHAKAIVSTAMGAEGLEFVDGQAIQLKETAEEFARACVALLRDPVASAQLGAAAHATFLEKYERGAVVRKIVADIERSLLIPA